MNRDLDRGLPEKAALKRTPDRSVPVRLARHRWGGAWPNVQWAQAWDEWLRRHRWDWFWTGTWRDDVTEARAEHDVARWAARVQRKHPAFVAVVGLERGAAGGRMHVHALVYLNGAKYGLPGVAGQRHLGHLDGGPWQHGNTRVAPFRPFRQPGRGAAAYTVKELTRVELYGQRMPPAYRPKRS